MKARYSEDGEYYDASLIQVVDDIAHVLYTGYNESSWVSLDDIIKIASKQTEGKKEYEIEEKEKVPFKMDRDIKDVLESIFLEEDEKKHSEQFTKLFKQYEYHVYGNLFDTIYSDFRSCEIILEELMTYMGMLRGPIAIRLHKELSQRMESDRTVLRKQWGERLNEIAVHSESSASLREKLEGLFRDYDDESRQITKKQIFNLFHHIVESNGYQHSDTLLRSLEIELTVKTHKDKFRRLTGVNAFKLSYYDNDDDDEEEDEDELSTSSSDEDNEREDEKRHCIHVATSHYELWCDTSNPTNLQKAFDSFAEAEKHHRGDLLRSPQHLHCLLRVYYEYGAHTAALEIASHIIQTFPSYRNLGLIIFEAAALLREMGKHKESRTYLSYLTSRVPRGLTEGLVTMEIARSLELEITAQNDDRDLDVTEREHGAQ